MKNLSVVDGQWVLSFRDEQHKLDSEADAEEMAQIIEKADRVEVIELRGNTIGVGAGQRLAVSLERHPELKRALWSDMFTGRLKQEIPPILRSLCDALIRSGTQLVELDLSDNAFGPIGAEGIKNFLESSSAYSLEVLKLNNNGLGAGGKIVANALIRCYENARKDGRNFRLKTFVAGRNRLEDPGALALAKAFQVLGSLEEITMYQDGIKPQGIQALATSLRYNLNLRIINFSDNTFTASGAHAMAQVIRYLRKLEVLNFGDCLCRDKGAAAILSSLSPLSHPNLTEVNLCGNELSPQTIEAVLGTFGDGFQLNSLVLHTNNLGGRFNEIHSKWEKYGFVDLGEESDDQGSLDGEDENDSGDDEELYSDASQSGGAGNESDDEQTADTNHDVTLDKGDKNETVISYINQRWSTEEDAKPVIQALLSKKFARRLDLHGTHLSIGACRKIADMLRFLSQKHVCNLEEVNLSQTGITADGIKDVANAFGSISNLRIINLSGNALEVAGTIALSKVLPSLWQLELLDLSSCASQELGILTLVANLSSSIHLRLRVLDFSSNGLGADAVQKIARVFASGGFHLERLSLHSNHIGHCFGELKEALSHIHFLDLGDASSDRGSLHEELDVLSRQERESGNEGDDECTEDYEGDFHEVLSLNGSANFTMDDIILFTRKPTLAVLDVLIANKEKLTELLSVDLHGRTQEVTAALLCAFCTFLSSKISQNRVSKQKIVTLTDTILTAAQKVQRKPVSPTESLCNQLLAYAGAVRSEAPLQAATDISGVIFLFQVMLQRGHFQNLLPTIKFSFKTIKETDPSRNAEIDRFLRTLDQS